jgi:hypothetical protein
VFLITPVLGTVADVFTLVALILSTITHVFATVTAILATVAPVLDTIPRAPRCALWHHGLLRFSRNTDHEE